MKLLCDNPSFFILKYFFFLFKTILPEANLQLSQAEWGPIIQATLWMEQEVQTLTMTNVRTPGITRSQQIHGWELTWRSCCLFQKFTLSTEETVVDIGWEDLR